MKTKICYKCTNDFASSTDSIKLCVPLYMCTLYNFKENYMNVQTTASHLKIDTCEIDIFGGGMNIFQYSIHKGGISMLLLIKPQFSTWKYIRSLIQNYATKTGIC